MWWSREFEQSVFGIAGSNRLRWFDWRDACLGHFGLVAFLVFISVGVSSAQVVHGSISGSILDASGAVVPDAKVKATSGATGAASNTVSNGAGLFRFAELPIGNYNVEVTKEGFRKYDLSTVQVSAGVDYGVGAINLTVGPMSQVVNVTAAPPLMESTEAQISTAFSAETLSSFSGVQENQGLDSLALLLPGVNNTREDTYANTNGPGFSVNGLRGRSNDQQIDGQNNNDNFHGGPAVPLSNPNFVQAYQIVTNNFGPEYGRNSGALVNLVTPSGTNHWHGTIVATETNSALQTLSNTQKELGLTKVPWFNGQFASATIGGPAWKNHVFVFGGFDEQITGSKPLHVDGLTPTPNGLAELASCFPNSSSVAALRNYGPYGIHGGNPRPVPPITDLKISGSNTDPSCTVEFGSVERTLGSPSHQFDIITRADLQWTTDRVYVRYFYNHYNFINDIYNGAPAAGYPVNIPGLSHSLLIGWTHLLTPQMTNEFRIGYQGGNYEAGGNGIGNTVPNKENIGEALARISIDPDQRNRIAAFGPPINLPQGGTTNTYQIQDRWSYVRGKSQWKAGVNSTHHTDFSVFLPYYNGEFSYQAFTNSGSTNITTPDCTVAPSGSLTAFAAFACNIPASISIADGNPTRQFREQDTFLYVGNDYKFKPKFTLNVGLTWSYFGQPANFLHNETVKRESNPATAFWNPTLPLSVRTVPEIPTANNNWGPSVGFAWSPNWGKWLTGGSGKTVLRGGYRLAYDPPYYNMYLNVLVSAPVVLLQTLTGSSANANPLPASPFGSNVRAALAPSLTLGALDPRAFDQTTVSPNFGSDHVHSWSLGIQREVTAGSVFEIRYVGNHGQNLFQSINANPLIADLAASFPKYLPPGAVPCPAKEAVVPSAIGRLNCNEGMVRERTNTGYSDYNGLQIHFRTTELWKQLTLMTSYTWSKTTDNVSEIFTVFGAGTTLVFSQNSLNYTTAEHGNSGLDFPHVWTMNFYEQIPAYWSQHGIVGHILGGWAVSGNYTVSSGQPYSPVQSSLNYLTGGAGFDYPFDSLWEGTSETARPFLSNPSAPASAVGVFAADACAIFGAGCTLAPNSLLSFNVLNQGGDPKAVTQQMVHFIVNGAEAQTLYHRPYGDAARNSLRDAIINSGNFALIKTVRLNEGANLQWHMTMLNVFNHPNYPSVDPFLDNAGCNPLLECGFATPSASEATVRQILFGIKINW